MKGVFCVAGVSPCMAKRGQQSQLQRLTERGRYERPASEQPPELEIRGLEAQLTDAEDSDGCDTDSDHGGDNGIQRGQAPAAADGAAQRPLPNTSTSHRANSYFRRICMKGVKFLRKYSKQKWAAEAAARAQQGISAEDDEDTDLEEEEDGRDEARAGDGVSGVARCRQYPQPLVEPEIFICMTMPDGKIRYASSAGFNSDDLCRHQRDLLIEAMLLHVERGQLTAGNDPRAVRQADRNRRRGGGPVGTVARPRNVI